MWLWRTSVSVTTRARGDPHGSRGEDRPAWGARWARRKSTRPGRYSVDTSRGAGESWGARHGCACAARGDGSTTSWLPPGGGRRVGRRLRSDRVLPISVRDL